MKALIAVGATALLAAAWTAGSNAPQSRRSAIPLGEWAGRGVCLYEWWDPQAPSLVEEATKDVMGDALGEGYEDLPPDPEEFAPPAGDGPARPVTIHRRYPTELKIWEGRLDGRDVVMVDIRSRRGRLPQLGAETHMLLILQEAKRVSRTTALYRVLGLALNPEEGQLPTVKDLTPPASATCTTLGDTTVLQIRYLEDFVDVLRFQGREVEKTGLYHARGGLVHWTEQLRERR
ncbi:MAG: hypothetical protein AB1716_06510 [Planctomycetota bacterium]